VAADASATKKAEELADREKELDGQRAAVREKEQRQFELEPQIDALTKVVAPAQRQLAEQSKLPSEHMAARDLDEAKHRLERFDAEGPIPTETIREEKNHLLRNIEELQAHVRSRQSEADLARREVDQCRADYIEVVRATLHDYARRARALTDIASAQIEFDQPNLDNTDRSLDEAGIAVRIGFDGKPPTELGGSAHSGGQKVISGLVLLMAMAETDSESFFILDEPFAHLSLDKIDDVDGSCGGAALNS